MDDGVSRDALLGKIAVLEHELATLRCSLGPLVNLKTASHAVGYSGEAIRGWARSGKVIATRNGAAWQIDLPSVIAYVSARRRSRMA